MPVIRIPGTGLPTWAVILISVAGTIALSFLLCCLRGCLGGCCSTSANADYYNSTSTTNRAETKPGVVDGVTVDELGKDSEPGHASHAAEINARGIDEYTYDVEKGEYVDSKKQSSLAS